MELKTYRECNQHVGTQVFYTRICVASQKHKEIFKDENIFSATLSKHYECFKFNGRTLFIYKTYWNGIGRYEKYDKNVHVFTTEQEAIDYIEQFKLQQYDIIRRKLVTEKLKCLNKIKEINEKFKQLR